jgi:hypothetical protein
MINDSFKTSNYSLIPQTSGSSVPNSGYATKLIESSRVVLTGGNIKCNSNSNGKTVSAGSITIN